MEEDDQKGDAWDSQGGTHDGPSAGGHRLCLEVDTRIWEVAGNRKR